MMQWKWINDNGEIYLISPQAVVIIYDYKPLMWDLEDFLSHITFIPLKQDNKEKVLFSAWLFFSIAELIP